MYSPTVADINKSKSCTTRLERLELSGNYMYHLVYDSKSVHFANSSVSCVLYDYHNKQRLFP
jgi:hypothetical protein